MEKKTSWQECVRAQRGNGWKGFYKRHRGNSWTILGSCQPRTETREEMLCDRTCCLRVSRKLLREEWCAVHEVLGEEEYHGCRALRRKSLCSKFVWRNFSNLTATDVVHRNGKPPPCG